MNKTANHNTVLEILRAGSWFRGLNDDLLRELAGISVSRTYQRGEVLFARSEPGSHIYGLVSGSVRITTESEDGREFALNTIGPGEVSGEIAALDGGVRTATGTATVASQVFVISREHLMSLMLRRPEIAIHMIDVLCERVRKVSRTVEETAFLSVPERLASHLSVMVASVDTPLPCRLKISQRELASFLNTTRQSVNITLKRWQNMGLLEIGRGSVEVIDLDQISADARVDRQ
ncbi:MAG: cyclic nucleotide-binding domain-containing protein [Pseudomonadales bacterium]|nr:cyclic nucleotide-binding domain-containing protein [Pseudomonadales bacterium]